MRTDHPGCVARILPSAMPADDLPSRVQLAFGTAAAAIDLVHEWDADTGVRESWWVRADTADELDRTIQILRASYPGIEIEYPPRRTDPAMIQPGERAYACGLRPRDDSVVGVLSAADAATQAIMLGGLAAAARVAPGQRTIIRLVGQSAPTVLRRGTGSALVARSH